MAENVHIELIEPNRENAITATTGGIDDTIHPGRLNLPSAPEVAILLEPYSPRDSKRTVVCCLREHTESTDTVNHLSFIPVDHSSYSPLAYPLL